jgi:hypothetical protein
MIDMLLVSFLALWLVLVAGRDGCNRSLLIGVLPDAGAVRDASVHDSGPPDARARSGLQARQGRAPARCA